MKKTAPLLLFLYVLMASCFPENLKKELGNGLRQSQDLMADMNFKRAIGCIELHKLRTGVYPDSLSNIEYTSDFDAGAFTSVQYRKLDSGYELNSIVRYQAMNGAQGDTIKLDYPAEFWKGLGCRKSNLKK